MVNVTMSIKPVRSPLRTWMVRVGITLLVTGSVYLCCGLLGWLPLQLEVIAWNNIRIVSGVAIAGCLMAAFGFGDE